MSRNISRVKTRDYVLEDVVRYTPVDEERNRLYRRWATRLGSLVAALLVLRVLAHRR